MTAKYDPIFKLLKKHDSGEWIGECQIAFDKVKDYLSTSQILVPPIPGKPLILYLTIHEKSMGCVLGQCRRPILSGLLVFVSILLDFGPICVKVRVWASDIFRCVVYLFYRFFKSFCV